MPRSWSVWILYLLPLYASYWISWRHGPLYVAALCTLLTILGQILSAADIGVSIGIYNRGTSVAVFWVTGLAVMHHKWAQLKSTLLAAIIESTPDFVAIAGADEGFRYMNRALRQAFVIADDEDITRLAIHDFRTPESFDQLSKTIIPTLLCDGQWSGESTWLTRDGRLIPISQVVIAHKSADGAVESFSTIARDITERKLAEEALRRERDRFNMFVESVPGGIVAFQMSPEGKAWYPYASDHFIDIAGINRELLARDAAHFLKLIHSDDYEPAMKAVAESAHTLSPFQYEFRYQHPLKGKVWLEVRSLPSRQQDGSVLWYGITLDITERKQSEKSLRENEERPSLAIAAADLGLFERDHATDSIYWSPKMRQLFGWDDDAPASLPAYVGLILPEDRATVAAAVQQAHDPTSNGEFRVEHRIVLRDGSLRWVSILSRTIFEGLAAARCPVRTIGTVQDITGRKQAEIHILAGRERLAAMSRQLITTQETERRHLARELHDEIGQSLTGIKLNLNRLQQAPASLLRELAQDTIALVDQTLQQVRNLALDLRPSILDDLGLVPALRWCLDRQSQRGGFATQFSVEPAEFAAPPEIATACFRIVQECLTNVARHARARKVLVQLRQQGKELTLLIHDDGIGFDVEADEYRARHGASLGLLGMQDRVQLFGGALEIESTPSLGTTICARFPPEDFTTTGLNREKRESGASP